MTLAPGSRREGADPIMLSRQYDRYGSSIDEMPALEVKEGSDGRFVIFDGVTRATRAAKLLPGALITVEVTGKLKCAVGDLPTVGEKL